MILLLCGLFYSIAVAQDESQLVNRIALAQLSLEPSTTQTTILAGAIAAEAAEDTANSVNMNGLKAIGNMINSIFGGSGERGILEQFKTAGLRIASSTNAVALGLAGALGLVSILWVILLAMAKETSIMGGVVEEVIILSLIAFLLRSYSSIVGDVFSIADSIAQTVNGGGVGVAVTDFVQGFFFSFVGVVVNGVKGLSFKDWLFSSADLVVGVILILIACYYAFSALIELIGVLLIAPVVVGLALAFGPVFIACLASTYTRRWFDTWLNFLIGGAFLSVITLVILTLINQVIISKILDLGTASLAGSALAIAIIGVGCSKVFSAIPALADAMLPGRTGGGSGSTSSSGFMSAPSKAAAGATSAVKGASKSVGAAVSSIKSAGVAATASPATGAAVRALSKMTT